jgi:hypothetical protein
MFRLVLAAGLLALSLGDAFAQSQPYAGMQTRAIKALSEQQIGDLKAGRGMGLALVAELNGYPGPIHVLELSDALALKAGQLARVQALVDNMKAETKPLGEQLIAQEAELDRQFSQKRVTRDTLMRATAAIGETQGALRNAHLKYHLATLDILSPTQVQRYAELRGYQSRGNEHMHHHR